MFCMAGIAFTSYFAGEGGGPSAFGPATATPVVIRPEGLPTQGSAAGDLDPLPPQPGQADLEPRATDEVSKQPVEPQPQPVYVSPETLETLENTIVPVNDLLDLARRLEGKPNIPQTVDAPTVPYRVGDRKTFWVRTLKFRLFCGMLPSMLISGLKMG